MPVFAYLRVSTTTHDQTTDNQKKLIQDAGFGVTHWVCEDGVSGSVDALDRPAFKQMMVDAQKGDTVICTMIDRLGRTASDILNTVDRFKKAGIHLRIMQFDGIDVTSSTGKMIITVMSGLAEMEKNLLIERTKAGLARTKEQGTILGPPLAIHPKTLEGMLNDRENGMSLDKVAVKYKIARQTAYRNMKKWEGKLQEYKEEFLKREAQYIKGA